MRGLKRRVDERLLEGGWMRGSSQAFRLRGVYCVGVVQYSMPILCRRKGDAEIDIVIRDLSRSIVC